MLEHDSKFEVGPEQASFSVQFVGVEGQSILKFPIMSMLRKK